MNLTKRPVLLWLLSALLLIGSVVTPAIATPVGAYTKHNLPEPLVLNGAVRFAAGGSAGMAITDIVGTLGSTTAGSYFAEAATVSTTGTPVIYIPLDDIPAIQDGNPVWIQELAFSGAKVTGTGGGVVQGTHTWLTSVSLFEMTPTASSATVALGTAIWTDTTDRLTGTQSATPTDFSFTGIDVVRTSGTKLILAIATDCNDEAVSFKFYMGDHGYIATSNRPPFRIS